MDLYFVRHAETIFNVDRRYYGKTNPPLTKEGISQMEDVADELSAIEFDRIYTSSLERTIQSAHIICERNQWPSNLIQPYSQLNEMDFGRWEGLTANEVEAVDAKAWMNFMEKPFSIHPTDGESFAVFKERVLKAFKEIIQSNDLNSTLLFIGHLGALRLIIHHYFEPKQNYFDIEFSKRTIKHYTIGEKKWDELF